jgi:uncharacterized protein
MLQTNLYTVTVPPMLRALENLSGLVDKAAAHAESKKAAVEQLLNDRLVFDQFHFAKQVRVACNHAKRTAALVAGIEDPAFEDTEATPEELKARIEKTAAFLKTIRPEQMIGKEDAPIAIYYLPGKHLPAFEYVTASALPNFYFHVVTAYSILRKNGVAIGKSDYIGSLPYQDTAAV